MSEIDNIQTRDGSRTFSEGAKGVSVFLKQGSGARSPQKL